MSSRYPTADEARFTDKKASLFFYNLKTWADENELQMLICSDPTLNAKIGKLIKYPHLTSNGIPIIVKDRSEFDDGPDYSCDIEIPSKYFDGYDVPFEANEDGNVVIHFHFLMLVGAEYHFATDDSGDGIWHHLAIFSKNVVYNKVLTNYMLKQDSTKVDEIGRTLIIWQKTAMPPYYSSNNKKRCEKIEVKDRFGLERYLDDIAVDITALKQQSELMARLGVSSCVNYLLSGPAGVGKTSLVKIVSDVFNMPIFCANSASMSKVTNYNSMLSPDAKHFFTNMKPDMFAIVLIEDFVYTPENASEILNALDGVLSGTNLIRFFSTNSPESLASIDFALKSRFHRHFTFQKPNLSSIFEHLRKIFPDESPEQTLILAGDFDSVSDISFRTINRYIARHVASPDIFKSVCEGIPEWKKEMASYDAKPAVASSSSSE